MIKNDHNEKERVDSRNALEEYIYDMRDKLAEEGSLASYIVDSERQKICNQLNDLENWLYEEGEDCEKDEYRTKLTNLHNSTDPIKARFLEYESQPNEYNALGHSMQMAVKAITEYRKGDPKYDHLTETEILNVTEAAEKAQKWHDEQIGKFRKSPKTADLPIKSSDIRQQIQTLTACTNSVFNRSKPKPPSPPVDTAAPNTTPKEDETTATEPTFSEDKMDVE